MISSEPKLSKSVGRRSDNLRLVLALKIQPPTDQQDLALQILSCLEKLPIEFSSVVAFTPDEGLNEVVATFNKVFSEKKNDQD